MKRYHVTTFGCQMNEHDSERMKGMLESLGYEQAGERSEADLILFNTCSIRESADFIKTSIIDPAAEVAEGYPPDVMPTNFGDVMTPDQIDSLVGYLVESTSGSSQ